jgi:predicted glycoside hydrolase/deacetylase ChbG (UPF0249 family)
MNLSKRLIINADDFGACREVNMAVMQIARAGILGGASVLANGMCWQQAVDFLRDNLELSAGIHLNVVEGRAISAAPEVRIITDRDGSFPGLSALLKRWILRPLAVSRAVEIEWRAQIEKLMRAGVWLKHADSHQHLHAFPPAYCCAVRLCQEYGIPALRHPCEKGSLPIRRKSALALQTSLSISQQVARHTRLRHNDNFLGFRRVGAYGVTELIEDLRRIPKGLTEIALHPSIKDGIPYPKLNGDLERKALLDDSLPGRIKRLGIELTTWSTITQ